MKPVTQKALLWVLALAGFAAWLAVTFGTIQVPPGLYRRAQLGAEQSRLRFVREGVESGDLTRTGEGAVEALIGFEVVETNQKGLGPSLTPDKTTPKGKPVNQRP
jgi:hypothetical protein